MIHQVIKGARNLHRESYALLKQSENRCFLHVWQVLFVNRYKFYCLLLSPKLTLKLKLQLWKVPPGTKPRARFCEPSWMDSKTNWFPPPEVLGIADGSWLEGAGGGTTAEWVAATALFSFPAGSKNSPSLFDIVLNCSNVGVSQELWMLASLWCPVIALICRLSMLAEDRTVTVVGLIEWIVRCGIIQALVVIKRSILSSGLSVASPTS